MHTRTHVYWGWHPLQGVYLHNWGGGGGIHQYCIHYRGVYLHCWGCTFIAGGVHTRTHVYWGWHPLQGVYLHNWGVASTSAASTTGGVPSYLGVCIPGHICTGGGIHYRGCTFITITGGWHPPVLHPLQGVYLHHWGVPSYLGMCIPGCMCTGSGIHYRGGTFITGGWHPPVLHPLQGGVHSSLGVCIPGCMCTGGGIQYRGCTFITGGVDTRMHVYWGCTFIGTSQKYLLTWIETKICLWDNIY